MYIKCSKTFTAELNKQLKPIGYKADLKTYTPEEYAIKIDYNVYRNGNDYDAKTGKLAAILIYYPESYYATPRAITTLDLSRLYKQSDGTAPDFWKKVLEEIQI